MVNNSRIRPVSPPDSPTSNNNIPHAIVIQELNSPISAPVIQSNTSNESIEENNSQKINIPIFALRIIRYSNIRMAQNGIIIRKIFAVLEI